MPESNVKNQPIDYIIRIGLILMLVTGSLLILAPFMIPIVWGIIIAVALWPVHIKVTGLVGNKKNLSATLITILAVLILVIPSLMLMGSIIQGSQFLIENFEAGTLTFPGPTDDVKAWPLIGEPLYHFWDLASHNLKAFINEYSEQIKGVGSWLLETITGLGLTILQFLISIIIAGVFLAKTELGQQAADRIAKKLVGKQSEEFVKLTTGTIRSVVQGVIGIAAIQAVASTILLLIGGIPFAGLWALLILVLAIMQLPPLLILGPIVVYAFTIMGTTGAIVFSIFAILISISDSLLKPIFLGRGVEIPMLVILLGAIGGMLVAGILGLFIGAVILALSYKLTMAWLNSEEAD